MRKEISELIRNQEHMLKAIKYLDERIVEKERNDNANDVEKPRNDRQNNCQKLR